MRRARPQPKKVYATMYLARGDEEVEVELRGIYVPGEESYFNYREGVGHPGCPADVEDVRAYRVGGPVETTEVDLTEGEAEAARVRLVEEVAAW